MKTGLVWLIGKPGSGKTTVGEYIVKHHADVLYYSFSSLLKKFQKEVGPDGFLQETRERVYSLLRELSKNKLIIVSGNPYTKSSFADMKQLSDTLKVIYLDAPDELVLRRLATRNRDIFVHDGASQEERLEKFNQNVLPLVHEIVKETGGAISVEDKTVDRLAKEVISSVLN